MHDKGFPPIADTHARILILGIPPTIKRDSLKRAHNSNIGDTGKIQ